MAYKQKEDGEVVTLSKDCSTMLQNKLPCKLKDPGSFNVSSFISSLIDKKALVDLGASINVMLYRIFKKLGLGQPQPTTVTTQLGNRSIRHPRGTIEDVLVKVDRFIFLVNFVILDVGEDAAIP